MGKGFGWIIAICALSSAFPVAAATVSPNAGPVAGQGTFKDHDGRAGTWSIRAVLKDGKFTGNASIAVGGASYSGDLLGGRSYVENDKCYFAFEQGRARVSLGGPCNTERISGKLDGFLPGTGGITGEIEGTLKFGKPSSTTTATTAGVLPVAKLTCAWWETRVTYQAGELNGRELRVSNMASLSLSPNGTYRTANSSGKFVREGNRIRLASGAFAGAVGQLRPDRSGRPAVYFERNENQRANGVSYVDPATTACTQAGK